MTRPWGTPQEPQQGDRFREADAWNRRLLLRPTEYIPDIKKLDTRGDALKLNVVDLDDQGGPRLYQGILWFSGPLIGVFKGDIGTPFIGYITKEKNANGYMAWKFYDLAADADTDARAQQYLAAHPEFLDPLQPAQPSGIAIHEGAWGAPSTAHNWGGPAPSTAHHEVGPAPAWAGATPQRPAGPPAAPGGYNQTPPPPPAPGGFGGPPAPPAPPRPPVSAPPAAADPADVMARLRRQAGLPGAEGNVANGEPEPPF